MVEIGEFLLYRRRRFSKGWAADRSRFKPVFRYIDDSSEPVIIEALDDIGALGLRV